MTAAEKTGPSADELAHIVRERYQGDALFHAQVHFAMQALEELGIKPGRPELLAAGFALLAAPGERKKVAVITPTRHYFDDWRRLHPEFDAVMVNDAYAAQGHIFDTYVCHDPTIRFSPSRLGEITEVVRTRMRTAR